MKIIKEACSKLYLSQINSDEAEKLLLDGMTAEQMAEFIVDAINRGWISRFNLGIDDKGNVI